MTSQDDRIRNAFDELRATHSSRTPGYRTILDRRVRRRRVRPAAWSLAAAAILATFLVARGTRPDDTQSIATWRAPSDELIQEASPLLYQLAAGSAALNELLPATLQIGGGQ